ncbi:30S ribosomal protein S5 [Candidatus Desantisbacteria bacterium]|nr:30S ribosomal protein S5 [Candidatus Desantisbacteria bacterium]
MAEERRERKTRERKKDGESSSGLKEKVVFLNRVAKVVKGGKRFGFSALVVVGDEKGQVGVGIGKAKEVPSAIAKGVELAKKSMFTVALRDNTVPCFFVGHFGAGRVILKPAAPGTGIVAGAPVRAVMEAVGIKDILTKTIGTNNPINVVHATLEGLKAMKGIIDKVELRKGK